MTLVRSQPQLVPKVQPQAAGEMTVEQLVLVEVQKIGETVNAIAASQRDLRIQLMGSAQDETEHGRLPRVEDDVRLLKKEVQAQREAKISEKGYRRGAAAIGGAVGALAAFLAHVLIALLKR
jgi:hypothetical protein